MPTLIICPLCGHRFRLPDNNFEVTVACPRCKRTILAAGETVPDYDVFICHSVQDKAIASAVCASFEALGYQCWMAPRDIAPGEVWAAAIIRAIGQARAMVVIVSGHANATEQVLREVERAVAKRVALVPFRIQNVSLSADLEYFLGVRPVVDGVGMRPKDAIARLVQYVRALLDGPVTLHRPAPQTAVATNTRRQLLIAAILSSPVLLSGLLLLVPALRSSRIDENTLQAQIAATENRSPTNISKEVLVEESARLNQVATVSWLTSHWFAHGQTATLDLGNRTVMEFVWIPPGSFLMGTPEDEVGAPNERPLGHVAISNGFWVGATEVTQRQWTTVMGSNPSHKKDDNLPVDSDSWNDCQSFISALTPGVTGAFRLSSEAEWEYACRSGTRTPWSFDHTRVTLNDCAWNEKNADGTTHFVAQKLPNAWGLYDMHGSLAEWCQDWYHDSYNGAPANGSPWELPVTHSRVLRGGSFLISADDTRSAARSFDSPDTGHYYYGFRLVRSQN